MNGGRETFDTADSIRWTVNSTQPAESLLREVRICVDPRLRAELRAFHAVPQIRAAYFRKTGLTVDEFGEVLWDRGLVLERPDEHATLDWLTRVFSAYGNGARKARREVTADRMGREQERERTTRANNRHLLWACDCGKSRVRGGKSLNLICGHCGCALLRRERTLFEINAGIELATIQAPGYQHAEREAVPF